MKRGGEGREERVGEGREERRGEQEKARQGKGKSFLLVSNPQKERLMAVWRCINTKQSIV